jgi:hypothetical protein
MKKDHKEREYWVLWEEVDRINLDQEQLKGRNKEVDNRIKGIYKLDHPFKLCKEHLYHFHTEILMEK